MAGSKKSKATKKFEKNQLKSTLERRKDFAKVKQRHRLNEKRKEKAAKRVAEDDETTSVRQKKGSDQDDMDNDEYFRGEPSILKAGKKTSTVPSIGKRKRNSESPVPSAEETSEVEQEDEDDFEESASDADDADEHKNQISALAEKDPEFYKYLQENDAELLDFDADDDLAGTAALSEDEDDARPVKKAKTKSTANEDDGSDEKTKITQDMVRKWRKAMTEQYSMRATRQVVLAFRAAAHVNDEDENDYKFSIPSSDVYHDVLTAALKDVPQVLQHHLPVKETAAGKIRVQTETSKFTTLAPLIKSQASSIHHLLTTLSDPATLRLTLQSFEPMMPYLLQFRKFLKVIIKSLVGIWSDNSNNEATRISSFLIIRRLMVIGDGGLREAVLKSVYEGIVRGSRNTTVHTLAGINLMENSAAEIWGIDQKVGYTTGFNFIRQLAMHLRTNVTKPTKDSYKTIYNWQYVHSLDFWSRVLATHCNPLVEAQQGKESQLRPLIYPVVQITLGVMRLIPTSTYFPLRFHLIRSLLRISQSTGTYIPLASSLLEVLQSTEMKKTPKPSTLRPLDFTYNYRAPTSYLKTRVYQDGIGEQVVELFSEFFALWAKSIAFPELQLPVVVMLKRWLRSMTSKTTGNKNTKINQSVLLLVQKLESNARWIEDRRNKVTFAPKDRAEVSAFLKDVSWEVTPLGAFVIGQRKLREERKKVLEVGRKEDERKKKKGGDDEDLDMADLNGGDVSQEDESEDPEEDEDEEE